MADPRIAMLKAVPLFAECDDKQLAFIATQVDEVDFVAGRDLCREGASGGEFFVILTGTAEVRRQGRHLRELGPGDFFGEDRKSTRLNSSHVSISYAVFCL